MKNNIISGVAVALLTIISSSCSNDDILGNEPFSGDKLKMEFNFSHPSQTRATETAFETGDKVGLFVNPSDKPIEIAGNTVNNQLLSFSGNDWTSERQLYWDKGKYNAYAYYPYQEEVSSVTDFPFSVKLDQSGEDGESGLGGMEASDFLYASEKEIEASANPVNMKFKHIMSKLTIRLIKGEDFEGDIPENATVFIHNTVTSATIDLSAGIATKNVKGTKHTITARQTDPTTFTAITVPQRLDNRVPLIEVVMNGVSFMYESKFQFKPGINHLVNLIVDKNPEQVKIEVGGEITDWN